jgi:hypothetical protein
MAWKDGKKRLVLRLDDQLYEDVRAIAEKNDLLITDIVRLMLRNFFKDKGSSGALKIQFSDRSLQGAARE